MRTIAIMSTICLALSCSDQAGVMAFDVPVTGKEIAENWNSILEKAQPCGQIPCGTADKVLFKVNYPKFSLVFAGGTEEKLEESTGYMSIYKEMDGKITDLNLYLWIGEGGYFHADEFYHQSTTQEFLDSDNPFVVADTGIVIPPRQE